MFKETLSALEQSGKELFALIGGEWKKVKIVQLLDDQVKLRVVDETYDAVMHYQNVIIKEAA